MRDGCNFDISKIFKDGKPLIIDGTHVDPECYVGATHNEESGNYDYRIVTPLASNQPIYDSVENNNGLDRMALLAM